MKIRVKRHAVTQPLDTSYRLIPLTQGQNAIVDLEDFEWLSQWNWCADWNSCTRSFYAQRRGNNRKTTLHRCILKCKHGEEGDHKNGDTLDHRRKNLRKCNRSQNMQNKTKLRINTSGYKG